MIEYLIIAFPVAIFYIYIITTSDNKFDLAIILSNLLALGYTIQRLIPLSTQIGNAISAFNSSKIQILQYNKTLKPYKNDYKILNSKETSKFLKLKSFSKESITLNTKKVSYVSGTDQIRNLEDISLNKGDIFIIYGKSGVGKTSLLDTLSGLIKPYSGQINLVISGVKIRNQIDYLNNVSYLFQNPYFTYDLSEEELEKWKEYSKALKVNECLERYLRMLDFEEDEIGLSGGQMQRLALARVFTVKKPLYILDEPTSALDESSIELVISLMKSISKDSIIIAVSHLERLRNISTKSINLL